MCRTGRPSSASGFTLVEVLIAVAIFITLSVGVAQLIAVATRAVRAARERTSAAILAAAKMEQLRSLAWTSVLPEAGDPALARSDRTTDLSHPDHPSNGVGLQASPAGTLGSNTPPYVDYVDGAGRWVGHGSDPPASAVFIRRWAVQPLATDPERTLVLQVLVTTVRDDRSRTAVWSGAAGVDAVLVSVLTRKGQ
jgi:prepilin-type N-terminal cleavage/methylation domain-containing protein